MEIIAADVRSEKASYRRYPICAAVDGKRDCAADEEIFSNMIMEEEAAKTADQGQEEIPVARDATSESRSTSAEGNEETQDDAHINQQSGNENVSNDSKSNDGESAAIEDVVEEIVPSVEEESKSEETDSNGDNQSNDDLAETTIEQEENIDTEAKEKESVKNSDLSDASSETSVHSEVQDELKGTSKQDTDSVDNTETLNDHVEIKEAKVKDATEVETGVSENETAKLPGKVFTHQELVDLAKQELNEDPDTIQESILHVKQWIRTQPHLAETAKQDDQFIQTMLRGCKYKLGKTKRRIEIWNTVKSFCPELYDNWDVEDPDNKHLLGLGFCIALPGFDKHGRKVMVYRPHVADPKTYKADDLLRIMDLITDVWVNFNDHQTEVCGIVLVIDNSGMTFSHLSNFSVAWCRKATTIFQEMYPARPKMMHFLNMPNFVSYLFNLVRKAFMTKKMQERMAMYPKGDYSRLVEDLGLEVLPEEYGGSNGKLAELAELQIQNIAAHREFILDQTKLRSDETKRRGRTIKKFGDIFNVSISD